MLSFWGIDNPTSPFIHHRFGEGFNDNQGVRDYTLSGWNKWYHIVCSNGGIGELARTYINGKFVQSNIRYERRIVSELIQNSGSILNIGADYGSGANNSWNHYLGIIDDIRFYNKPFGRRMFIICTKVILA